MLPTLAVEQVDPDDEKDEVVAYSDSTAFENPMAAEDEDMDEVFESKFEERMVSAFENMAEPGIVILAVICVLAVLLFFLAPLIIVILLIRYFIKRNNARVALAEKAMETGQPIPDELKSADRQSSEYLRRRGIRNIALGLGLLAMFSFWHSSTLQGIGALIAIYGCGQYFLSRTPVKDDQEPSRIRENGMKEPTVDTSTVNEPGVDE